MTWRSQILSNRVFGMAFPSGAVVAARRRTPSSFDFGYNGDAAKGKTATRDSFHVVLSAAKDLTPVAIVDDVLRYSQHVRITTAAADRPGRSSPSSRPRRTRRRP